MRRSLALFLLLAAGCAAAGAERDGAFLLGGIQVNEPDHGAWVEALQAAGMNAVQVTVYARQGDWDTADLWWESEEPWVVAEARAAKARGLAVVLVLRVALDHAYPRNRFFWHGMILPTSDAQVAEWFRRYGEFVDQWAGVAQREGIDLLAIASEMNSLASTLPVAEVPVLEEYWANAEKVAGEQGKLLAHGAELAGRSIWMPGGESYPALDAYLADQAAAHRAWARQVAFLDAPDAVAAINERRRRLERGWEQVIEGARAAYAGRLTYAANFDQYREVGFWDRLDLLAINAYFPLRERLLEDSSEGELLAALRGGWRGILADLDAFRRATGIPAHPVLFSELGYT
ncbi:MAG: glycoside hydrolase family 113, partial [Thermoanaerobaculia bacterium]